MNVDVILGGSWMPSADNFVAVRRGRESHAKIALDIWVMIHRQIIATEGTESTWFDEKSYETKVNH